jgi:O-antigen ligase
MITVTIIVGVVILTLVTLKYPPISLLFFLTAGFIKATLMLKFPFFRVVDYTVLCAVLMLIAMTYSFIRGSGRLKDIMSIPMIMYLLLATLLLFGIAYTSAPNYGFVKSSRFATLGLIAFLAPIAFTFSLKEVKLTIWVLFTIGIIITVGTIIAPEAAVLRLAPKARGAFLEADPLGTATMMGVASIIAFAFVIMAHTSNWLRIVSLAVIPLTIGGVIITGSRGPFLGMVFTWLMAVLICRRGLSKIWVPIIGIIMLIAMVASFVSLPEIASERIATVWKSGYDAKEALYSRTEMFSWTAKRISESLIFGHGTGAFAVDRGGLDERAYPHNIFLEVLYEQGLVGTILLLAFLWLIFRRWRQSANLVQSHSLAPEIYVAVHIAGLEFLFTFVQAMKSSDLDWNRLMFFCAGLVVATFNLVCSKVMELYGESELVTAGQQRLEEVDFQDA